MICEIEDEYLEELISEAMISMGEQGVVKFLIDVIDVSVSKDTVTYLKRRVEKLCDEHHFCRECGGELEPIIVKEIHSELDGSPHELMVDGYKCVECGSRFE